MPNCHGLTNRWQLMAEFVKLYYIRIVWSMTEDYFTTYYIYQIYLNYQKFSTKINNLKLKYK